MKYQKTISLLVLFIVLLSLIASAYGAFANQGRGGVEFKSLHQQTVPLYGKGLYKNDSASMALQGKAQDLVTMALGVPLLLISLYLSRKGSLKGRLLLTGTLGYFLYTYASYSFLMMYNAFFLIYVMLMSASFHGFVLAMLSFAGMDLSKHFDPKLPVRLIGGFLIFMATVVGLMWLGMILAPLLQGRAPLALEHYTTLVIQAMDLGLLLPAAVLAGILLIKRKSFGYLLAPVMIFKVITLLTAVTAMAFAMLRAGVKVSPVELTVFPLFDLVTVLCLWIIVKNMKENGG